MTREEFAALTNQGIVYLDGATGSNLYLAGMPRGICTEQWILEHEQVMMDLQKAYADAGSMAVYAPTFGANRASLSAQGLEGQVEELNQRLVDLSQRAVGGKVLIGGDISPTGKILVSQGGMATVDEVFEIYREQIALLAAAGVDFIAAETMLSVEETMVALDAAQSVCDLPVICTLTLEADGNALYGGNAVEAVETLGAMGASAVGVNCSVGPDQLENIISNMKRAAEVPVIAKPNAGLPYIDDHGNAVYSMGPEEFAKHMRTLVAAGASIVGGCCGTTPEYIRKMRLALEGKLI
ncbi:MAG: homocysteine S-methyltransferase family protein [Lachnospiraceae bacterium]|nr:homocysteine S-methyltransferase family protein [Lachnospiraceae bacterium]